MKILKISHALVANLSCIATRHCIRAPWPTDQQTDLDCQGLNKIKAIHSNVKQQNKETWAVEG